jgi:putative oxidoreductase
MDFTWLSRWQPQMLAVLRIVVALLFIEHATIKLFGFPPGGQPGLQAAGTFLWIAGMIEMIAGLMVLVGLFTRLGAFIAAGEMAVAYWMVHAPQSPWPIANGGEGAILFCFIFLYLAAAGPGAWSVDSARTGSDGRIPRGD